MPLYQIEIKAASFLLECADPDQAGFAGLVHHANKLNGVKVFAAEPITSAERTEALNPIDGDTVMTEFIQGLAQ